MSLSLMPISRNRLAVSMRRIFVGTQEEDSGMRNSNGELVLCDDSRVKSFLSDVPKNPDE